jgi:hypothetical protein
MVNDTEIVDTPSPVIMIDDDGPSAPDISNTETDVETANHASASARTLKVHEQDFARSCIPIVSLAWLGICQDHQEDIDPKTCLSPMMTNVHYPLL